MAQDALQFIVGEAVVEGDVGAASFCCDLKRCKGACCTLPGGRGAPLEDDEVLELQKAYPAAKEYLSQRNIEAIEAAGMAEGTPGNFVTTCIDQRDCVFVYYEDDVARCSLERAFEDGKTDWRKPLSCHLFPIRVRDFGREFVRYEQLEQCEPGRDRGIQEGVKLYDFLKMPLIRKFGEEWYKALVDFCRKER
jgi:hypothetical protein